MFHLMPYRELPEGFEKIYPSSWFTLPFPKVADANRAAQYYNWTLDELEVCRRVRF